MEQEILIEHPKVQKRNFIAIVLVLAITLPTAFGSWLYLQYRSGNSVVLGIAISQEREKAIQASEELYKEFSRSNWNFDSGQCLANEVIPGWGLDIVHDPRIPEDDLMENQCRDYAYGLIDHIVEFNPEGNLIRAE